MWRRQRGACLLVTHLRDASRLDLAGGSKSASACLAPAFGSARRTSPFRELSPGTSISRESDLRRANRHVNVLFVWDRCSSAGRGGQRRVTRKVVEAMRGIKREERLLTGMLAPRQSIESGTSIPQHMWRPLRLSNYLELPQSGHFVPFPQDGPTSSNTTK